MDSIAVQMAGGNQVAVSDVSDDDDDLDDSQESTATVCSDDASSSSSLSHLNKDSDLFCCVCYEMRPNILLLPCKHLKVCNYCWDAMCAAIVEEEEDSDDNPNEEIFAKCPYCKQEVQSRMEIIL